MRFNVVLRYMGMILMIDAMLMLVAAGVALYHDLDTSFYPLLLSALLTVAIGAYPLIFVERSEQITNKEGFVIVVGSWLTSCFVGAFPYLLWGGEFTLADTWFESVSGYTTTGATILSNVEALPHGLLFWRASTHLLGGLGVVLFALLALPSLGRNKMTLSSVELSSIARDNYRYRAQKTIRILLAVYLGMIFVQTILLKFAGMGWFDSVTTAFSTIATGGFSNKNNSIAFYNSASIDVIVTVFMLLASIHFGIIFATFTGKSNNFFRSEIVRYYIGGFIVASIAVALCLWYKGYYESFLTAWRFSSFQLASLSSTTGYATADTNLWPAFVISVLVITSFQGGMAGSTAGGIKADRVLLSFKLMRARIIQQQHPTAVIRVKLNDIIQEADVLSLAMLFIVLYFILALVGTLIVTAFDVDFVTAGSSIIASMGNIGPGFGIVGTMGNYSTLPEPVKLIETIFMLLGRLEIFGFIQLFIIKWWK